MALPNGSVSDNIAEAASLPNIDDRPSVLADLQNCILNDDENFSIGEVRRLGKIRLGKPSDQDWVRCHPDPARSMTVMCMSDKNDRGSLYVVSRAMLEIVGHHCKR